MKVLFLTSILPHYRVPFHEHVRQLLCARGVEYELLYGQPQPAEAARGDTVTLSWGREVRNRTLRVGSRSAVWQPALQAAQGVDLIVVTHENKLIGNYPLQLLRHTLRAKVALWGHGRNFQSRNPNGALERWKNFWAQRCDWWFAYTEESRRQLERIGFPTERITVFNNAVDTGALRRCANAVSETKLAAHRAELGLTGGNVGVYVGGIYAEKRIPFLIKAADRVRLRIPDFELLVIGGGPGEAELRALAASRSWIKVTGPRFGPEKAELMLLAKLFLMPSLLGLAVLDACALGLPSIITDHPGHGPELTYLEHGRNGLVVPNSEEADAYSEAIAGLLEDEPRRLAMAEAARRLGGSYTVEAMADRFTNGVLRALSHPDRHGSDRRSGQ